MEPEARSSRRGAEQQVWRCLETIHSVVYFAPQAKDTFVQLGLRGFWMGYFASRAAPLGPVGPDLVGALFFGFAPRMVARALPEAWTLASPQQVLAARTDLACSALTASAGHVDLHDAVDILDGLVDELDLAGRPLAAVHAALVRPAQPLTRLWHLAGVLREYRGDGHVAALVTTGVDGAQSHIWHAAGGLLPAGQRESRGWTAGEWSVARESLQRQGWLDADSAATPSGAAARADLERRTDDAAAPALERLSDTQVDDLRCTLAPVAAAIIRSGAVPYPNAVGVAAPLPIE